MGTLVIRTNDNQKTQNGSRWAAASVGRIVKKQKMKPSLHLSYDLEGLRTKSWVLCDEEIILMKAFLFFHFLTFFFLHFLCPVSCTQSPPNNVIIISNRTHTSDQIQGKVETLFLGPTRMSRSCECSLITGQPTGDSPSTYMNVQSDLGGMSLLFFLLLLLLNQPTSR